MSLITGTFKFMGQEFTAEVTHNAGTNNFITSASLEPNDEEEFVVESISSEHIHEDLCDMLLDDYPDEITEAAYKSIISE